MAPANKVKMTWTSHATLRTGGEQDSADIAAAYEAAVPTGEIDVNGSIYSGPFVLDTVEVID